MQSHRPFAFCSANSSTAVLVDHGLAGLPAGAQRALAEALVRAVFFGSLAWPLILRPGTIGQMTGDDEAHTQTVIAQACERRWPGVRLQQIVTLKADASARRFWRIFLEGGDAPATAIAVDLGPEDLPLYARTLALVKEPLPEPPFISVQRLFASLGIAVPEIFLFVTSARLLLVEDVGEASLFDAALANPSRRAALYKLAIDELLLLHVRSTRARDRECLAWSINYDERLFLWELEQFLDFGLPAVAPRASAATLQTELQRLAAQLGSLPRALSHRDYHGRNLFVQDGRIRVIDFQDALLAPDAQDLALLLTTRDTSRIISPELEDRLLRYYFEGLERGQAATLDRDDFLRSYRLCVLQHALKVIGRFVFLEQQGKHGYLVYLPHCIFQARRMLASLDDYPRLREALSRT